MTVWQLMPAAPILGDKEANLLQITKEEYVLLAKPFGVMCFWFGLILPTKITSVVSPTQQISIQFAQAMSTCWERIFQSFQKCCTAHLWNSSMTMKKNHPEGSSD